MNYAVNRYISMAGIFIGIKYDYNAHVQHGCMDIYGEDPLFDLYPKLLLFPFSYLCEDCMYIQGRWCMLCSCTLRYFIHIGGEWSLSGTFVNWWFHIHFSSVILKRKGKSFRYEWFNSSLFYVDLHIDIYILSYSNDSKSFSKIWNKE